MCSNENGSETELTRLPKCHKLNYLQNDQISENDRITISKMIFIGRTLFSG